MTKEEIEEKYIKEIQKDIKDRLGGEKGKNIMEFLSNISGHNGTIIVPESQMLSNVNEGRRQLYMVIETFLNNSPDEIVATYKEKFQT